MFSTQKISFTKIFDNKDRIVILLTSILYFFFIKDIVFPENYQQDDVSELRVINILDFQCLLNQGDNHPLWTYFIWFSSKIPLFRLEIIISSINITLLLTSLFFLWKTFTKLFGNTLALLLLVITISSPSVLTYSVSLKQYMIEFFYSSFCLYKVIQTQEEDSNLLISKQFITISIISILGSLVNFLIFLIVFVYLISNSKIQKPTFFKLIIFLTPIYPYLLRIYQKVSRSNYAEYWQDFFISFSSFSDFFDHFVFIFNLLFKSFFGYFYFDQAVYFLLTAIIITYLISDKNAEFPKVVLIIFIILNLLKLYPLGSGRTDIVLLPFFIMIFGVLIKSVFFKINIYLLKTVTIITIVFLIISVNPFYKIESMTPLIHDLNEVKNLSTSIIISPEQAPSFEYYSKDIFGEKIVINDECYLSTINLDNYFILGKKDVNPKYFDDQMSKATINNSIFIIGIELEGTKGRFRDAENYLLENKYKLQFSNVYKTGIYLNSYKK